MIEEKKKYSVDSQYIIGLVDFTSLNDTDTKESIEKFCDKAVSEFGKVACICVYQRFLETVQKYLMKNSISDIRTAVVCNFPSGENDLDSVKKEAKSIVEAGSNEIDVVIPYRTYIHDRKRDIISKYVESVKEECVKRDIFLKVILESGAFESEELLFQASVDAIQSGADFIKTSTGKTKIGATTNAVRVMLKAIKQEKSKHKCGIKVSGGIRTIEDAITYIDIVKETMNMRYLEIDKSFMRIGASSLVDNLLNKEQTESKNGY